MTATASTYVFDDAWSDERVRIGSLEAMLDPGTAGLLDALGVGPGWRCLEVGAGAGSVARRLAERVGPGGHVLATDVQTAFLEPLASAVLEVRRHDVCADDPPGEDFDLVHVRWTLHWVADRPEAVRRLLRCLRPGGWLLAEEPLCVSLVLGGDDAVVARVLGAALDLLAELGGGMDPLYGQRMYADLAAAGAVDLASAGRTHMLRGGDPATGAAWLRFTVAKVRDALVERGAAPADVDHVLDRLDDPAFVTVAPTTMAVWGRRPA
ncbi:MAG TPA: methyltransferase [Pseudonocardia sp.]|jgi:SAM-dependent methyltransferase|nr:methyltransferase [Pseudonocardia sp.]